MRNETPYLCGVGADPTHRSHGALTGWIDQLSTGQARRRGLYAVEVCWISGGFVTCRSYQVRAISEARAARLACQCAGNDVGLRASRIEAVDVEPLEQGAGHE